MSNTTILKPPPKWHILSAFVAFVATFLLEMGALALGDLRSRGLAEMEPRNAETYHAAEMILIETPLGTDSAAGKRSFTSAHANRCQ